MFGRSVVPGSLGLQDGEHLRRAEVAHPVVGVRPSYAVRTRYVVGADPAEGNPTSDPSALEVLDADSGEEVASLAGRYEPATSTAS